MTYISSASFSPKCTPSNVETTRKALMHSLRTQTNAEDLAKRILNQEAGGLPLTQELSTPDDVLIKERVRVFLHPDGQKSIVVIGEKILGEGNQKKVCEGWLATAEKVISVAFIWTKGTQLTSKDRTAEEHNFLESLTQQANPCCPEVFIQHRLPLRKGMETSFLSIQRRYATDLSQVYSDLPKLCPRQNEILEQTAKVLHLFHQTTGLLHRDIKPANFLVDLRHPTQSNPDVTDAETQMEIRLTDFGFATHCNAVDKWNPGTPLYCAPELAHFGLTPCFGNARAPASTQSDIWSLGITWLEIEDPSLLAKIGLPKRIKNLEEGLDKLATYFKKGQLSGFPEPEDKTSKLHLIWRMLQPKPENRPSLEEIRIALPKCTDFTSDQEEEMFAALQKLFFLPEDKVI